MKFSVKFVELISNAMEEFSLGALPFKKVISSEVPIKYEFDKDGSRIITYETAKWYI